MNIPQQLKPLSEKGESFIRETALAFASIANGSLASKKNDEIAWNYFNRKIDKDKFKYLTHVGDFVLPSPIRMQSIQRPPMNLLISQQARRPFVSNVLVDDESSIREKFKNQFQEAIKRIRLIHKQKAAEFEIAYKKLLKQEQEIQQQLQQEPQDQEQAQMQQQLMQQLPEIETAFKLLKEEFEEKLRLSNDELKKINDYLTFEYKELKEMLAQKGMVKLRDTHGLKEQSVFFFTDKIVTGKGRWYVDYIPGEKSLRFEALDSMQVHYPSIPGTRYIQDGTWAMVEDWISYSSLIDEHGDAKELTDTVIKELEYFKDYSSGEDVGQANANVYTGALNQQNGINRKRIWWKSPRKVFVKHTPNKHKEGKYFRHFINDEKQYDVKPDKKKGEIVKKYFIYDLFTATIIDNKYVVDGRRIENPLRSKDNLSRLQLPIIGRTYSSHAEEPYSLIWSTKDIQDLYNIVCFHEELYIAASGVKGQVVDLSQKPDKMSIQEHQYHKKIGNLYIQTLDKSGRKINSSYNQWKDYDDTLSPAIQYLAGIKQSLENACKETMGVSRQRMGQTVNSDQVGTSEMARDQSALVTEVLYYESDLIEAMAMRRALNLQVKHLWDKETMLQITHPDGSTELIKIPANLLNKSDYDVIVLNNTDDQRNMDQLRQMMYRQHEKGQMAFKNIVQMYNKESLVELQKAAIRWDEEQQRIIELSQQNAQQAEQEAIKLKGQMDNEMKAMVERDKSELGKMKLQLDQMKIENDKVNNEIGNAIKEKGIDTNKEIELLKILSNREVEMNFLDETTRNNTTNQELQALQLQLQQLQMQIDEKLGEKQANIKSKEVDNKKKIEAKKMSDKNRIKN